MSRLLAYGAAGALAPVFPVVFRTPEIEEALVGAGSMVAARLAVEALGAQGGLTSVAVLGGAFAASHAVYAVARYGSDMQSALMNSVNVIPSGLVALFVLDNFIPVA